MWWTNTGVLNGGHTSTGVIQYISHFYFIAGLYHLTRIDD